MDNGWTMDGQWKDNGFTIEGRKRVENAEYGLERMESVVETLTVIPNDKLLEIAPELPLQTAFKVADEILTNAVKGIAEMVTKAGLVNLDFADIKAVMANGGVSLIGIGESDSTNRAEEAIDKALNNPLLDVGGDLNPGTYGGTPGIHLKYSHNSFLAQLGTSSP